ncbi:alkyl sulfatase C-terminal domain-containing protein [Nocardia sp. AG03]|uniref:alkyl sulfatase C-terminal domain-containing protein n=1 Tax=Nocardia sp. AG03 TaxID=3025312 RepID=UPI0024183C3C|nr:alkyl sulfatase C-terminal domain-containing protein [Nocardia sp. AG03]
MPIDILFDFVSVHVIGEKAADVDLRIALDFTDHDEQWHFWVRRGVLNARRGESADAQLTIAGPKAFLTAVLLKPEVAAKLAAGGKITLTGDEKALDTLAGILDDFDPAFPIVTP